MILFISFIHVYCTFTVNIYVSTTCGMSKMEGNTTIWTSRTKHGKGCRNVDECVQRKSRKEDIKCKSTWGGDVRKVLVYSNEHG